MRNLSRARTLSCGADKPSGRSWRWRRGGGAGTQHVTSTGTGTDRGGPGAAAGAAAAARRAGRAGASSSRAAGRARPARAWRGRGRRSWVAPSLRCERPPTERVAETLPRYRRFFPKVFFRCGRGRGAAAANGSAPPPPPPAGTLIYVPYIKRVFRVPLWIFLREFYIRSALRTAST